MISYEAISDEDEYIKKLERDCSRETDRSFTLFNLLKDIYPELSPETKARVKASLDKIDPFKVNRYCFACKAVKEFIFCDNCGKMFCPDQSHCDWETEYGEFGSIYAHYPVHRECC